MLLCSPCIHLLKALEVWCPIDRCLDFIWTLDIDAGGRPYERAEKALDSDRKAVLDLHAGK